MSDTTSTRRAGGAEPADDGAGRGADDGLAAGERTADGTAAPAPGETHEAAAAAAYDDTAELDRDGVGAAARERLFDLDDIRPRRRRNAKWDRPRQPRDWRWYVGSVGKLLIALGVLMFGFVAYQLWGTGIETARAQRALENEFEELLAVTPPVEVTTTVPVTTVPPDEDDAVDEEPVPDTTVPADDTAGAVPVDQQNIPDVVDGDAIARIEIPAIGVDDIVVAGVEPADLKKGPGHYPTTPMPGQLGNAAIAGHRTTYGQPFHDVDDLQVGDEIVVTTLNGQFTYVVTGQQIVTPSDYQVVATTDPTVANLTLTSCHPKWSARERIVIFSELDPTRSAPIGAPVLDYGRNEALDATADTLPGEGDDPAIDTALPGEGDGDTADSVPSTTSPDTTGDDASDDGSADDVVAGDGTLADGSGGAATAAFAADEVSDEIADAFSEGWFSDPGAYAQVALWGSLLTLIALGSYLLSRRTRRDWVGAMVGIVPFVVTLYFFFQNVNRMLPPNL